MADTSGKLVLIRPSAPDREFELSKAVITLGRASANDIVLSDARVSRFHARIDCGPEGCLVFDLGSANGVQVNGQTVEQAVLSNGDTLQIGNNLLRYELTPLSQEFQATMIDSELELDRMIDQEILPMAINETGQPRLVVFSTDKTWEVPLAGVEVLKIGRADDNDLVLPHTKVSRYHAELARRGDKFLLQDLHSTNGTFIGDKRVDELLIENGDLFRIGPAQIFFKGGFSEYQVTVATERLQQSPTRKPVIFIPGFMGSELWRGSERVWPNVKYFFKDSEIFKYSASEPGPLRAGGILDQVVIVPNLIKMDQYNRLGDYFVEELGYQRGVDFFEFAYDWRQDVRRTAQELSQLVDKLTRASRSRSLPTVSARWWRGDYLTRLGGDRRVERAMLMGGPHRETLRAVNLLLTAGEFLPFGKMGERVREVGMSFPNPLPDPAHYRFHAGTLRGEVQLPGR